MSKSERTFVFAASRLFVLDARDVGSRLELGFGFGPPSRRINGRLRWTPHVERYCDNDPSRHLGPMMLESLLALLVGQNNDASITGSSVTVEVDAITTFTEQARNPLYYYYGMF